MRVFMYSMILMVPVHGALFKEESNLFEGFYSENYVMRWHFQNLCHHVYDKRTNIYAWPTSPEGVSFNPKDVKEGDIIFVRQIHRFMKKMHPRIKYPYIMVTAGEARDLVAKDQLAYLDDEKVIAWFALHHDCKEFHSKFHQIPIGLYQDKKYYKPRKKLTQMYAELRRAPKDKLLYSNYGDLKGLKPERAEMDDFFEDKDYCFVVKKRIPFLEYMKEMSAFKFALSPRGYGPDTYRTWEALMVGTIPIVRTSQLDRLYANLPILIIKDWEEITEGFLKKKYKEITKKKWPIDKLFMEYWERAIMAVREEYLQLRGEKA